MYPNKPAEKHKTTGNDIIVVHEMSCGMIPN